MAMPVPPTLEDVSRYVMSRGLSCTAGHLSSVEHGTKRAGPRLLAVLAEYYQVDREDVIEAMDNTEDKANGHRKGARKERK